MRDRPILFSAPMVRATIDDRKTQTRRILKPQPHYPHGIERDENELHATLCSDGIWRIFDSHQMAPVSDPLRVRFAKGDRLWVRETLREKAAGWTYDADGASVELPAGDSRIPAMIGWAHHKESEVCVSIHMPRWASRLTLTVTDVRVERLQAISEADALAEGAKQWTDIKVDSWPPYGEPCRWSMETPPSTDHCLSTPRWAFANLWEKINGTGAWLANPWVVAVTSTVEKGNIDA